MKITLDVKEQDIQSSIINYLRGCGCYVVKVISASKAGVPDIIGCTPDGQFFAFEVKKKYGRVSKLQDWNLYKIRKNKGLAAVVFSLSQVKKIIY